MHNKHLWESNNYLSTIRLLWAKSNPYVRLIDHLLQTGECAQELLVKGSLQVVAHKLSQMTGLGQEEIVSLVSFIAAIHDIGKAHPFFQAKGDEILRTSDKTDSNFRTSIESLKQEGLLEVDTLPIFRHEEYSGELLKELLPQVLNTDSTFITAISRAVALHHQGKGKSEKTIIPSYCQPKKWKELQREIFQILLDRFDPPRRAFGGNADATVYLIMGIVILSDWIASDLGEEIDFSTVLTNRGLDYDNRRIEFSDFCSFWRFIPRDGMRGIQKAVEQLGKSPSPFYIVEAPMGEGKSEASLYLAACQMRQFSANGFYIALPTSATGNQMHSRVNDLFAKNDLPESRLLHGTAWMIDVDKKTINNAFESETIEWLAPLRRAMLSCYAVGTVDQAMLAVMKVKYGVLRLLGLANKVLVLDEVHAYDAYMQTIIETLLEWCKALSIPVILLSATLPKKKKAAFLEAYGAKVNCELSDDYPLITSIDANGSILQDSVNSVHMRRRYKVCISPYLNDVEKTARLAIEAVEHGGCVCVLVNTVNRAQEVFKCLRKINVDAQLDLFHARFTIEQRNKIESSVVNKYGKHFENRPQKSILVATQVMEQSIDADFDAMITDLAPIDLLLQRFGRVHRFDNTKRPLCLSSPTITVLTSLTGYDDTTIYPGILMDRTEKLLREYDSLKTPEMIRFLVETVYGSEDNDDKQQYEMWAKHEFKKQLETAMAEGSVLPVPDLTYPSFADCVPDFFLDDGEGSNYCAKTRIGDGSQRIILIEQDKITSLPENPTKKEAKELMLQSASVRTIKFGELPTNARIGKGLIKGVVFLPTDSNGIAYWNNFKLYNDNELGIMIEKE